MCDPPYGTRGAAPAADSADDVRASPDKEFLCRLDSTGIPTDDRAGFVDDAYAVCQVLDVHRSKEDLVAAAMVLKNARGWTKDQAAALAVSVVRTYCPHHEAAIH
jgi:hypothetical protein